MYFLAKVLLIFRNRIEVGNILHERVVIIQKILLPDFINCYIENRRLSGNFLRRIVLREYDPDFPLFSRLRADQLLFKGSDKGVRTDFQAEMIPGASFERCSVDIALKVNYRNVEPAGL